MAIPWGVRSAIISGAASGIGQALAKALAADGTTIVVLDLMAPKPAIVEIKAECRTEGQQVLSFEADISDAPAVRAAVD